MADATKDFEELFRLFEVHEDKAVIVGARVFFIGKAELVRNKRAAGRPQDLADLSWLE